MTKIFYVALLSSIYFLFSPFHLCHSSSKQRDPLLSFEKPSFCISSPGGLATKCTLYSKLPFLLLFPDWLLLLPSPSIFYITFLEKLSLTSPTQNIRSPRVGRREFLCFENPSITTS